MLQVESLQGDVRTMGQRSKHAATGCNVCQVPLHCWKLGFSL